MHWQPDWSRATDPLGLIRLVGVDFLRSYHDETTWLEVTAETDYPDAVVAIARHLLWQANLAEREPAHAPDLVVTCRRGWYFGDTVTAGTAHGYPFADAMRASWFVSGPGIARGLRCDVPVRLVDLTPTILDLLGIPADRSHFDGLSRRPLVTGATRFQHAAGPAETPHAPAAVSVRRSPGDAETVADLAAVTAGGQAAGGDLPGPAVTATSVSGLVADWSRPALVPVYWDDVDLQAWAPLPYHPVKPSPFRPRTVNRPTAFWDLNNLVFNALSVTDIDLVRLLDDVVAPLARREELLRPMVDAAERHVRTSDHPLLAALAEVLNIGEVSISDYSLSSLGNMQRINAAVDWVQSAERMAARRAAEALERPLPAASDHVHHAIDTTQDIFWDAYRFVQRLAVQAIDEWTLNSIEDRADRAINAARDVPAEIIVR